MGLMKRSKTGRPRALSGDQVLDELRESEEPALTAKMIGDRVDVSKRTVYNRLDELVEDGKVSKCKIGNATAYWVEDPEPRQVARVETSTTREALKTAIRVYVGVSVALAGMFFVDILAPVPFNIFGVFEYLGLVMLSLLCVGGVWLLLLSGVPELVDSTIIERADNQLAKYGYRISIPPDDSPKNGR